MAGMAGVGAAGSSCAAWGLKMACLDRDRAGAEARTVTDLFTHFGDLELDVADGFLCQRAKALGLGPGSVT